MSNKAFNFKKHSVYVLSIGLALMFLYDMIEQGKVYLRKSISDYVNADNPFFFIALLSVSGFLCLKLGFTEKNSKHYKYIGLGLVLTAFANHLTMPIIHYISASGFFFITIYHGVKNGLINERIIVVIAFLVGLITLFSRLYYEPLFIYAEIYCVILFIWLLGSRITQKNKQRND